MLTLFATPKAFVGDFAVIQRRAFESWTLLRPRPQILVFGRETGVSQTCRELGITHIPDVNRNHLGTPRLDDLVDRAEHHAVHDTLCYLNSDMILMNDFAQAVTLVATNLPQFLMVGQRCTLDVTDVDFDRSDWENRLRTAAVLHGSMDTPYHIDYFVYRRGLFRQVPPFAIGRPVFDNWLIWKARDSGAAVVDATEAVTAIHQRHDYSHAPLGRAGVFEGEEARENRALAIDSRRIRSIGDATHVITRGGELQRAAGAKYRRARSVRWRSHVVERTRPVREKLGLTWARWQAFKRLFHGP